MVHCVHSSWKSISSFFFEFKQRIVAATFAKDQVQVREVIVIRFGTTIQNNNEKRFFFLPSPIRNWDLFIYIPCLLFGVRVKTQFSTQSAFQNQKMLFFFFVNTFAKFASIPFDWLRVKWWKREYARAFTEECWPKSTNVDGHLFNQRHSIAFHSKLIPNTTCEGDVEWNV